MTKSIRKNVFSNVGYAIADTFKNMSFSDIDIGILAHLRPSDMAQHLEYVGCSYFTQFQLLNNGLKLLCFTFYW